MDGAEKVREARLRRMARRQGLKLIRSRRRDPLAPDFGRYALVDPDTNRSVAGVGSMTLDDVETWLSSPGPASVEVTTEQDRRVVRRSVTGGDGAVFVVEHDFPDAVRHHYRPAGADEDVLLYRGEFALPADGRIFDGDVRYRWRPVPHVEVRGERATTQADWDALSGLLSAGERWVMPETVSLSLPSGLLPPQPRRSFVSRGLPERSFHQERIEQELGDPAALEQLTFLVPNGWAAHDGTGICDPDDPGLAWRGRTEAAGGGWTITFDRCAAMDTSAWNELRNSGGFRFTHVGGLARADGAAFTGTEAFDGLDRIRMGLNLALGRRVTCALPVGWRDGKPVWCRWRSARVDGYRDVSQWLDDTIGCRQVGEVVSRVLDFTAASAEKESLRHAVSYYVAANVDVDVELSASVPVSALQLLAFFRFVTQRGSYSRSRWNQMDTEEEIRLLVEDTRIETAMPAHLGHLAAVRDRLASGGAPPRDGLGVIVKMRNVATHPTRDQPGIFSPYEWWEAGMLARYWLCLSILNTVGYHGQIAEVMQPQPHWTGWLRQVPWSPAAIQHAGPAGQAPADA
jgi:hypothetical protein